MRIRHRELSALAVLVCAAVSGCGAIGGDKAALLPVKGKVTFKGQPVTKGLVTFEPRDFGRTATGQLQSDGTYVLSTFKEGDGTVAGHHRVSISGTGPGVRKELIPAKYGGPNTSRLVADVTPEQTEFNFDLK
jgi:hypothetical protein